jgi:hypothetical protein
LAKLAQGTVCKILDQEDVKPHKVRFGYPALQSPDVSREGIEDSRLHSREHFLYQLTSIVIKSIAWSFTALDETINEIYLRGVCRDVFVRYCCRASG